MEYQNDMKANELRIGNWVFDLEEKENTEVIQWTFESDYFTSLEPIPLTEEWKEKLNMPEWFKIFILEGYFNLECLPNGYKDIDFVHTAQNLYFALTNEELKIKL